MDQGPRIEQFIGKCKVCPPKEYMQKIFSNDNGYTTLDSFSIEYYELNEKKIRESTLEIFADSSFVLNCEVIRDKGGKWERHSGGELGTYLNLSFLDIRAAADLLYQEEGYRFCVIPISALNEKIPVTDYGPRTLKLVYKKISADTIK